jgi:thiamine transport system substrate-binding protein
VLGLDTNLTADAKATGFFRAAWRRYVRRQGPGGWTDDTFVPYDYGYFAVVYDTRR